jgi:hypothetical protein
LEFDSTTERLTFDNFEINSSCHIAAAFSLVSISAFTDEQLHSIDVSLNYRRFRLMASYFPSERTDVYVLGGTNVSVGMPRLHPSLQTFWGRRFIGIRRVDDNESDVDSPRYATQISTLMNGTISPALPGRNGRRVLTACCKDVTNKRVQYVPSLPPPRCGGHGCLTG